jgi:hypothetical protein
MKLFGCNKERVVQVRITNETLTLNSPAAAPPERPIQADTKPLNYELGLKLAALVALVLNSLLAIIGYVDFTGQLETLGISTNEIDLGLPTLLFQGYLAIVLDGYTYVASHFILGVLGLALIPSLVLYFPVSKLFKSRSPIDNWLFCMLLTMGFVIISIIPTIGLKRGIDSAYSTFKKQNPTEESSKILRLGTKSTILTKEGAKISGHTVFASTLYTYVLQGAELFKIANRDNHVVSVTTIHPDVDQAAKAEAPANPDAAPEQPRKRLTRSQPNQSPISIIEDADSSLSMRWGKFASTNSMNHAACDG